jgi:hypothetical protein
MKEANAKVDYFEHQLLLYVEKEDGSYGPLQTGAYMAKNYLDDFLQKRKNIETECIKKLQDGEISPVVYYMLLYNMTPNDIAKRVGISKSRVLKHQTPKGFAKAKVEEIRKYADVFGVSLSSMFQIVVPKEDKIIINDKKTKNPYFSILEIKKSEVL